VAAAPAEQELKLVCTPAALEQIAASGVLDSHLVGEPCSAHLVNIYFDTDDLRLARRRVSLRVRRSGERRYLTLKAEEGGGPSLDRRCEWEVEIADDVPDLAAFADPAVYDVVGAVLPGELRPRYVSEIERRTLPVAWIDAQGRPGRVEVAFDRGRIAAGQREEPIAEVEIELIGGSAQVVYEIAARLRAVAPLRIGTMPKAARGHMLLTGTPPKPRKAGRVVLDRAATVEEALRTVLRRCLAHALANEVPARIGADSEGVHQLRVALRRLRSALSLFAPALPEPSRRRWVDESRWLLGCLGPCRDLDVLCEELLPSLAAAAPPLSARLDGLRALADAERRRAQSEVGAAIESQRCGDLFVHLACWIEQAGWRSAATGAVLAAQQAPLLDFAAGILERQHRRVRKRGRRFAELDAAGRHRLRLAVKKLRYALEFFAGLFAGKRVDAYLERLADLQEVLGQQNDIAVSRLLAERLATSATGPALPEVAFGAGMLVGWQSHRAVDLEARVGALWEEFREARPFWSAKEATA
jgi:inorganic triphosphatase YgiF